MVLGHLGLLWMIWRFRGQARSHRGSVLGAGFLFVCWELGLCIEADGGWAGAIAGNPCSHTGHFNWVSHRRDSTEVTPWGGFHSGLFGAGLPLVRGRRE